LSRGESAREKTLFRPAVGEAGLTAAEWDPAVAAAGSDLCTGKKFRNKKAARKKLKIVRNLPGRLFKSFITGNIIGF
jgi:hypothetical protein